MTAYRSTALQCPTCHEAMEEHPIREPAAVVDLCARCGGVWIDWEDGDFTELAREVPPAKVREIPRAGPGSCPRCNKALVAEEFQGSAAILRCSDCAGAFLPYASIGKIAESTPAEAREAQKEGATAPEEAESAGATTPDEGTWARLVGIVRAWLGPPPRP